MIVALRCDASGEWLATVCEKLQSLNVSQRAGYFGCDACVVFEECNVGAQRCAAAVLSHLGQQKRCEFAAGDVVVFGLSQCVVECYLELIGGNFEFLRHRYSNQQRR